MTVLNAEEVSFEVDGLTLAGLAWGNPSRPPLLALHGWLDNAASFARLGPLLSEHYLLALDLTGHGRSAWRSTDATYNIYDDLPQLSALVGQLGWQRFGLLGHSRGAVIAALLAACHPEQVSHLVLLDGVAPGPMEETDFVVQLRSFISERRRFMERRPVVYPSIEKAVAMRRFYGLHEEAAGLIAPRNLRPCEGGYTWTTDPRLRGASAVKLTAGHIDAMLASLCMPTLVVVAEAGLVKTSPERFVCLSRRIPKATVREFPGGHHFHLEKSVATLAREIERFLQV